MRTRATLTFRKRETYEEEEDDKGRTMTLGLKDEEKEEKDNNKEEEDKNKKEDIKEEEEDGNKGGEGWQLWKEVEGRKEQEDKEEEEDEKNEDNA